MKKEGERERAELEKHVTIFFKKICLKIRSSLA